MGEDRADRILAVLEEVRRDHEVHRIVFEFREVFPVVEDVDIPDVEPLKSGVSVSVVFKRPGGATMQNWRFTPK